MSATDSSTEATFAQATPARRPDAQLLGQLTTGRVVVRLAGGHHATGGDVPHARPHVLGVGAAVHQQATVAAEHGDRDRPVLQPLGPHLGAGDGGDHLVVVVDDVDEFVAC